MENGAAPTSGQTAQATRVGFWTNLSTRAKASVVILGALITGTGTFFGVINGGLDLWDRLFPPPKPISAKLEPQAVVEPDVTWGTFVNEHPSVVSPPSADADAVGAVFSLALSSEGLGGKIATLQWVQRNQDGARIATPAWVPRELPVELREDSATIKEVWAPLPSEEDRFFLDYTLHDPDGEVRATAQSKLVRVGH